MYLREDQQRQGGICNHHVLKELLTEGFVYDQ